MAKLTRFTVAAIREQCDCWPEGLHPVAHKCTFEYDAFGMPLTTRLILRNKAQTVDCPACGTACYVLEVHHDGGLRCLHCVRRESHWADTPAPAARPKRKARQHA